MQQASRKAEPGNYKHAVNDSRNEIVKRGSKRRCSVHVQQRLNGPHGTPVHDFLSVA